jgi:hypothetical protein
MARNIPPDKLAQVSSYDVLGTVMARPSGLRDGRGVVAKPGV